MQALYWILEASLIRAWDSGRELQKDQTISKKNKSIIYQDIGILSLHSTTSNTARELQYWKYTVSGMAHKIYEQFVPPVIASTSLTTDQKWSKTKEKP